jgi:hypothetical protein
MENVSELIHVCLYRITLLYTRPGITPHFAAQFMIAEQCAQGLLPFPIRVANKSIDSMPHDLSINPHPARDRRNA